MVNKYSYEEIIVRLSEKQIILMKLETLILPLNIKLSNVHCALLIYNRFIKLFNTKKAYDENTNECIKAYELINDYMNNLNNILDKYYLEEFKEDPITINDKIIPLFNIPKIYYCMKNKISIDKLGVYKPILIIGISTVDYAYILFRTYILAPFIKDENEYKQLINAFNQCMKSSIDPLETTYNDYMNKYKDIEDTAKITFSYLNEYKLIDNINNLDINNVNKLYDYLESMFMYFDITSNCIEIDHTLNNEIYNLNKNILNDIKNNNIDILIKKYYNNK